MNSDREAKSGPRTSFSTNSTITPQLTVCATDPIVPNRISTKRTTLNTFRKPKKKTVFNDRGVSATENRTTPEDESGTFVCGGDSGPPFRVGRAVWGKSLISSRPKDGFQHVEVGQLRPTTGIPNRGDGGEAGTVIFFVVA